MAEFYGVPVRDGADDDEPALLVVCQGPPRCRWTGEVAFRAQRRGCVWCRRDWIDSLGRTVASTGPATA